MGDVFMYKKELRWALDAVAEASRLCEAVRSGLNAPGTLSKDDKSPVTVADFGAQALVSWSLATHFPGSKLVGEEDAAVLRTAEGERICERVVAAVQQQRPELETSTILDSIDRGSHAGGSSGAFWTLDPIDGTKGFLRGDQYAVALALIVDGEVVLGVLGCPALEGDQGTGLLFSAVKGEGARMCSVRDLGAEGQILAVMEVDSVSQLPVCESVESGHTRHGAAAEIAERLGISVAPVRMDSQCKYAVLARGEAGLYLRLPTRPGYEEKIWDHAAGLVIVQEAGGRVTDVQGRALDFSKGRTLSANRGVVASTGAFHDEVIAAVQAVLA